MSCPICANEADARYKPFCSRRCSDVDLAKWLGGGYALPSNDPEDAEHLADEIEKHAQKPH